MLNGEFGFLCTHTGLRSQFIEINEKEEWKKQNYDEFSKKYNGFMPEFRAPRRIYTCPLNYTISGDFVTSDHLDFVVYCLSMLYGVKLVSTKFSYIDNTDIRPLHLGYIQWSEEDSKKYCDHVYSYYINSKSKKRVNIIKNAIYLLFRMETRLNFPYETFLFGYTALDSCFKYYSNKKESSEYIILFLCRQVELNCEEYMNLIKYIVNTRNKMIHRGVFLGSFFAFKIETEFKKQYFQKRVEIFLKSLIIRLIFKLLKIDIGGFLSPLSLDETSIYIKT